MTHQKSTLTMLRDNLAMRRVERRERMRLERELAAYSSPADRLELDAIISRHTPEQTRVIEAIIARRAA
jgi:hypothetical protein